MKLYDYTQRRHRSVQVDPDAFVAPSYTIVSGSLDEELLKERYFKLTNFSKTLLSTRCNGLIYGGSDRNI